MKIKFILTTMEEIQESSLDLTKEIEAGTCVKCTGGTIVGMKGHAIEVCAKMHMFKIGDKNATAITADESVIVDDEMEQAVNKMMRASLALLCLRPLAC